MAQLQKLIYYQWDPDSAGTYRYGRFLDPVPGYGAITTSGSSTSVTYYSAGALDAYKHPFVDFAKYTMFGVRTVAGLTSDWNQVTTATDDQNIVIASAKDYTTPTTAWWYQKFLSGTTVADGWVFVGDFYTKTVKIVVTALTSTNITYSLECKDYGIDVAPHQLLTGTIASATALANTVEIVIPESVAAIRLGLKAVGGPNATDKVNAYLLGQYGNPVASSN